MNRISNNISIYDFEIDKIEELYCEILDSKFYFNDKSTNEIVKKFGNELNNFNSEMSLRVFPSSANPKMYTSPRNLPIFNQIQSETIEDCNRLKATFNQVKIQFDNLTKKNMMRFFI